MCSEQIPVLTLLTLLAPPNNSLYSLDCFASSFMSYAHT